MAARGQKLSIRARAPNATNATVRKIMRAVPRAETAPEIALRSALHRLGLRFYKDAKPIPVVRCKADVVFPRQRLCIFVDGCFWHGCPLHFKCPKSNALWWEEKITDNMERDKRQTALLEAAGWRVLRFWEHEVKTDVPAILKKLLPLLTNNVLKSDPRQRVLSGHSGCPSS